jgi:peptidoglycan/LPS O-acetylase OafA/YrhL
LTFVKMVRNLTAGKSSDWINCMPRADVAYRADVDGLRAISIIAVVGFHAFPAAVPGGFVGVDVFFVISGYLISTLIFTELKAGTFSFAEFYTRRAKRILPALLVVLIVVWIIGWRSLIPADFARLGGDIVAGANYLSNILFWNQTGYFDRMADHKPLLHLWSLAVEEQFYLLFPFFVFLSWKKRWNLLLGISVIGILSFAANVALVYPDRRPAAFYLPHARFWELMIGSGLAYATVFWKAASSEWKSISRNLIAGLGLVLLLGAMWGLNPGKHFPGWWALIPTVGTAILIFSGENAWINRTILSNKICVFVGLISYPLYLWHWPLLSFARLGQEGEVSTATLIIFIALAFVLAWLTYEFVEKPVRYSRLPVPSRKAAVLLAGFALVVITPLGIITAISDGFSSRFPAALQWGGTNTAETLAAYRNGSCFVAAEHPDFAEECVDKPKSDEPLLFVWGDSHAADLYPGLRALQNRYRFRLAQFTVSSCAPLLGIELSYVPLCKQTNHKIFARIMAVKPDWVILSAQWYSPDQFHIDWSSLNDTILALKRVGVRNVLVVGPVPLWRGGLPECLQQYYVRHRILPFRMKYGLQLFSELDSTLKERSRNSGASYASPMDLMCDDEGCLTRVGDNAGDIVAWDNVHLTVAGSLYLVDRFLQALSDGPAPSQQPELGQNLMSIRQRGDPADDQ